MRELLVICDSDSLYAGRLAEYISKRAGRQFDIRLYTSAEVLLNSLEGSFAAILIVGSDSMKELERLGYTGRISTGSVNVLSDTDEGICRYMSAEKIYDLIFINKYAQKTNSFGTGNVKDNRMTAIRSDVKKAVQEKLLMTGAASDDETIKLIDECLCAETLCPDEKIRLRNLIFYSIRGLDVLEELIADESITEIMVNGENNIFYEKNGHIVNSGKSFESREQLLDIIRKIVAGANRTVNMSSPIVDARLSDGSRINAVLEPVSLEGPILTIRRFPREPLNAARLIAMGAVSEEIMECLRRLVYAGYNILISGSTGSGKTTFLNILSGYIPKDERIITIEDSAELKIMGISNLVRLESRNATENGNREITIRDLIKAALRMRPDRVIVGECRGAEAIDMLQSFLVGQDGSMSTIHANSAEDALYRLEMLMMLGGSDIPLDALRRQIAAGVDIVIQLGRLKDKSRKLLEIREITGYEDGLVKTSLLYSYEDGEFVRHSDIMMTYKLEKAGLM